MFGWLKRRTVEPAERPQPYAHLVPGRRYHVVRTFVDHDGIAHPVGESWTFHRATLLPYEDGLSLFVAAPGSAPQQIRLQHRAEAEGPVIDALDRYVLPLPDPAGAWPLVVTRDSVCLADDIDAPHLGLLDVPHDADAKQVAIDVITGGYAAWVGGRATWSLALGRDRVLFGYRGWRRFVMPVGAAPLTVRAGDVERVHVAYHAQADAVEVAARMTSNDAQDAGGNGSGSSVSG